MEEIRAEVKERAAGTGITWTTGLGLQDIHKGPGVLVKVYRESKGNSVAHAMQV